jgi:hypothetical protein
VTKIALYVSATLLSDTLLVKLSVYCSSIRSVERYCYRFIEHTLSVAASSGSLFCLLFYSVWTQVSSIYRSIVTKCLAFLRTAMSVWFTWSINQVSPGSNVPVSVSVARSKYFYIVTLALNLLCTCKYISNVESYFSLIHCCWFGP